MNDTEVLYVTSPTEWREWLMNNHSTSKSVWLVFYSKASKRKSLTWAESVEVALCFGWIDSKKVKIDHETSHQFFSKRNAKSTWSKINKDKIQYLTEHGLMTKAGLDSVEIAKKNGSWNVLDDVENLVIPPDLDDAFLKHEGSREVFETFSKSRKKLMLYKVIFSKRPETRNKYIDEILVAIKNTKS